MKVFGRKLLDRSARCEIDFDDIVFEIADGVEIRVSVYRAKKEGRVEIQTNRGVLVILPRAANTAEAEVRTIPASVSSMSRQTSSQGE